MTRYDRYGDVIDDEPETTGRHLCDQGWLGEDERGRPIPCLECRPHLRRRS